MNSTELETLLWSIQREDMMRHGCSQAERDMAPLLWYINTGRAPTEFLRKLKQARPCLIARDLHKGGSYEEAVNRVCKRIGFERG